MATTVNFLLCLIAGILFAFQTSSICSSANSEVPRWELLDDSSLLYGRSRLEWTRSDNGHDIDWLRAARLCNALMGKWRLPTAQELIFLYESAATIGARCGNALCRITGPFQLSGDWFWSADSVGNDGSDGDELAWGVRLSNGARTKAVKALGDGSRALCVRSPSGSGSSAFKQPRVTSSSFISLPIKVTPPSLSAGVIAASRIRLRGSNS